MFAVILTFALLASPGSADRTPSDARLLLDTIESLQQPIKDFRCEFEGTLRFQGKVAEDSKGSIDADGRVMTYSGVFLWKQGGDTHLNSLQRQAVDGRIIRETTVVRMRERQAERYRRYNDASIGNAEIKSPKEIHSWRTGSPGLIFLIDKLKRDVADEGFEASVQDDQIDGRPLKVLSLTMRGAPQTIGTPHWFMRSWIDLRRNGHVVRQEGYQSEKMSGRLDVKLAPFKVGDDEVWMPVAGEKVGYAALVDKKPVVVKEPTSIDSIYVVNGTMEFNKNPGPEAFTIKYKLGTPISDHLRKMETEFGRMKIAARPTKREAEKMLNEQVAKAEEQKSELVVASPSQAFNWWLWTVSGLGVVVLITLIVAWIQSRGYRT